VLTAQVEPAAQVAGSSVKQKNVSENRLEKYRLVETFKELIRSTYLDLQISTRMSAQPLAGRTASGQPVQHLATRSLWKEMQA
jgi:hypothetical protein